MARKIKTEPKCVICGEDNPRMFFKKHKSYCKTCHGKKQKEYNRNTRYNETQENIYKKLCECFENSLEMMGNAKLTPSKRQEYKQSFKRVQELMREI